VLTLQWAATRAATDLIRKLKVLRAPSFGVIVEMSSFKDKSASGEFYNYAFQVVGPLENRAFYEENFAQYRFFIEHGLRVKDMASLQEDEARN
jgi:Mrp family chromosome partitioning ATPase